MAVKVVQIVKTLNNTELGKGGTHDTYALIPNDLDITDIFEPNVPIEFTDKVSSDKVTVRNTVGREKRIVGLGRYYRNKNLSAGDEVIFEKQVRADKTEYYIYTQRKTDNLVIQKSKYGFEILTPDRLEQFRENLSLLDKSLKDREIEIEYLKSEAKRNDSPEKTKFYDVKIAGTSLMDRYKGKEVVEIQIKDNGISVSGFYGWKKYIYETED